MKDTVKRAGWLSGKMPPKPKDGPSPEETWLKALAAATRNPVHVRWIRIAFPIPKQKRGRGRPPNADTLWLLCAAALQNHDCSLSKTKAISRVAEVVWPHQSNSQPSFEARLVDALQGRPLREFADWYESVAGVSIEYRDNRFMMTAPALKQDQA
jgi:hypothetical protein